MCNCSRRSAFGIIAAALALVATRVSAAPLPKHKPFVDAAFLMKDEAVAAGDQAYGAVVVKKDKIVGFGPSRVVIDNDPDAHAERVAMREAQTRLGTADLTGCVLYSTSQPCPICEGVAREAKVARMYFGPDATDAGPLQIVAPRAGAKKRT